MLRTIFWFLGFAVVLLMGAKRCAIVSMENILHHRRMRLALSHVLDTNAVVTKPENGQCDMTPATSSGVEASLKAASRTTMVRVGRANLKGAPTTENVCQRDVKDKFPDHSRCRHPCSIVKSDKGMGR